jgi:hypothetical protein
MKKGKTEVPELDITGLLSLKAYEQPDSARTEKNIQNIMRSVHSTGNIPSLLLFPERGFGWMIAQPRYGIAALFILFLGLHLIDRPIPAELLADSTLKAPSPIESFVAGGVETNRVQRVRMPALAKDPALYSPYAESPAALLTSFGE